MAFANVQANLPRTTDRFSSAPPSSPQIPARRSGTVRQVLTTRYALGRGIDQLLDAGGYAISFVSPAFEETDCLFDGVVLE
jgi:hypothetical protein